MNAGLRLATLTLFAACATPPLRVAPVVVEPEPAPALRLDGRVLPLRYAVRLAVSPVAERFQGTLELDLRVLSPVRTVWMHGEGLDVTSATFTSKGKAGVATVSSAPNGFLGFTFPSALEAGDGRLAVSWSARVREKELDGLFRQTDGGNAYLYTDTEPSAARRIFPCFDEPVFKVPWQLTLTVPESLAAFANMPVEREERDVAAKTRTVHFQQSPPLPSYLVAFAVGPFDVVDAGVAGRGPTPIRILTPKGKADRAAYAARITGRILERLEAYFDSPHPFPKLDLLVVPQRKGGAMENPGLISYGEWRLLERPGEQSLRLRSRQAVLTAHELAHQWFGNWVTLRWWDDVWLNESFAQWIESRIVRELEPTWATDEDAVEGLHRAFQADELVTARKIRQPIGSQSDVMNAFDRITYAKGAAVLRMLEAWLTPQALQTGIRAYLARYAWSTVSGADFLNVLSETSGQDVRTLFASFVDQPGLPALTAELACLPGQPPALALSQRRFLPLGSAASETSLWQLPVCVRYDDGKRGARACTLLTEPTGTLALPEAKACPRWVAPNAGAVGYYRARVTQPGGVPLPPAPEGLSVPERLAALDDAQALARAGALELKDALSLAALEARGGEPHLVSKSIELTSGLAQHLVAENQRAAYRRFVQKTFGPVARKLGLAPVTGEDPAAAELRIEVLTFVAHEGDDASLKAQGKVLARRWLKDPGAVDADLILPVMALAAADGDRALYEQVLARTIAAKDAVECDDFIQALAQFRTPALIRKSLELFRNDAVPPWALNVFVVAAQRSRATQRTPYDFVKANYPELAAKLPQAHLMMLSSVGAALCDPADRQEVDAFFRTRSAALPGGQRVLAQTLERIDQCALLKARQQPSMTAFLSSY